MTVQEFGVRRCGVRRQTAKSIHRSSIPHSSLVTSVQRRYTCPDSLIKPSCTARQAGSAVQPPGRWCCTCPARRSGLLKEVLLGAIAGMCIGGFLWSHEAMTGRQFKAALKRAAFGAAAGLAGGAAGAGLGNIVLSLLGKYAADLGGMKAALGMALSVGLGWALLGATIGMSGGMMIRSRDRALYGLAGGGLGGFVGGMLFNSLSATSIWSVLAGLALLGRASAYSSASSRKRSCRPRSRSSREGIWAGNSRSSRTRT